MTNVGHDRDKARKVRWLPFFLPTKLRQAALSNGYGFLKQPKIIRRKAHLTRTDKSRKQKSGPFSKQSLWAFDLFQCTVRFYHFNRIQTKVIRLPVLLPCQSFIHNLSYSTRRETQNNAFACTNDDEDDDFEARRCCEPIPGGDCPHQCW